MDNAEIFKQRREALFKNMAPNSIALLPAATIQYRNSDTEHYFRQESNFQYLTGFPESFAIAVFIKTKDANRFVLFCQDRDPKAERWTGKRFGVSGACEAFNADEAYSISESQVRFPQFLTDADSIYYLVGDNPAFDKKIFSWLNILRHKSGHVSVPTNFYDLRKLLSEQRKIKDKHEISQLQKACDISIAGHVRAMKTAKPGLNERHLNAALMYEFYQGGGQFPSYPPIVAAGENACVLHYTANNADLQDGDLVLIDAGVEYDCYAADITRTFPVNGKFSASQQAIYEIVLNAQLAAIEIVKPDVPWHHLQGVILQVLVQGLVDLKILSGDVKTLIEEKAYLPYYMHNSGHWLGLDVHDVGEYKNVKGWHTFQPGMVFTVEPGLYLPTGSKVDSRWQGIGVRIEDDVVVTENGYKVLSSQLPKSVADVENLMK